MTYTILSAQYSNADETAAAVLTEESSWVLFSQEDTPDLWADLQTWGTPEPFVPPVVRQYTRLDDVYERAADDAEADAIETAIAALGAKSRNLIRTREVIYHDETVYTSLKNAIHAALTSERADLLMAASP